MLTVFDYSTCCTIQYYTLILYSGTLFPIRTSSIITSSYYNILYSITYLLHILLISSMLHILYYTSITHPHIMYTQCSVFPILSSHKVSLLV